MLPKWTATYVRKDNPSNRIDIDVYAETIFQAWYNAMCIIQIKEKTEEFEIRRVIPKKDE
tara:strand:- start:294 stop:473 length:180 start_codon:yes stop_codon:yes gene_type:complete